MYLFFDTETTGLPKPGAILTNAGDWPRVVQIAWRLCDSDRRVLQEQSFIIKPDGFSIPEFVARIHGISTERALREGVDAHHAFDAFADAVSQSSVIIAHNLAFDEPIAHVEYLRAGRPSPFSPLHRRVCTMRSTTDFCRLPNRYGPGFKLPKLTELHEKLFGVGFDNAHDARADVAAGLACFFALQDRHIL